MKRINFATAPECICWCATNLSQVNVIAYSVCILVRWAWDSYMAIFSNHQRSSNSIVLILHILCMNMHVSDKYWINNAGYGTHKYFSRENARCTSLPNWLEGSDAGRTSAWTTIWSPRCRLPRAGKPRDFRKRKRSCVELELIWRKSVSNRKMFIEKQIINMSADVQMIEICIFANLQFLRIDELHYVPRRRRSPGRQTRTEWVRQHTPRVAFRAARAVELDWHRRSGEFEIKFCYQS